MKRVAAVVLALVLAGVGLAFAAEGDPIYDTFDYGLDGWEPVYHDVDGTPQTNTSISWRSSQTFPYLVFWTTTADGVILAFKMDPSVTAPDPYVEIQKTIYLQPGIYTLKLRAAKDLNSNGNEFHLKVAGDGLYDGQGQIQWGEYFGDPTNPYYQLQATWQEYTSNLIYVTLPGAVTFSFYSPAEYYLDYVDVYQDDTVDTPTPSSAWYTPTPYNTPIPPEQQATPMPTATRFCVDPIETVQAPPQFGITPTATPEPGWGYLDKFSNDSLGTGWSSIGRIVHSSNVGPDGQVGVLAMDYSVGAPNLTPGNAIVLQHAISAPVYVDGYAMADVLPSNEGAAVSAWLYDATGTWVFAGSSGISFRQWYPFHIVITDTSGTPPYTALAVTLFRSDEPDTGIGYIDNLYIYSDLGMAPRCSGAYPGSTTYVNPVPPAVPPDQTSLDYPISKNCPPSTMQVPNNFWGPLFAWMNVMFLRITALFPDHVSQEYSAAISTFADAPVWQYVSVVTMMFDFRPIIYIAMGLIGLEGVRALYSIWRIILKIIPGMG
jgi:hypothetical protein